MFRLGRAAALLLLLAGCRAGPRLDGMRMGPPPYGHHRIVGGAVPGWRPDDILAPPSRQAHITWRSIGPRPITDEAWSGMEEASGRVVSVAIHPSDPQTVCVAAASGGVWKTVDGGITWTPLSDELSTTNLGAVAIDPSDPNTIYAGTGEWQTGSAGDGLFRSTDGGTTWARIATVDEVGSQCSRVVVDPSDPQRIHVTGSMGYVRSSDHGATWTTYLSGSASGLAMDPTDPQRLYVGVYTDGIYRSLNGGTTWLKLTNGLPTSNFYRIVLACAPSNPNRVYAAIVAYQSAIRGLYRTDDGGDNWNRISTYTFPGSQGGYDLAVAVDPLNDDIVYLGDIPLYKSTDGGVTRSTITTGSLSGEVHIDIHALAFGPDHTLWVGCDGGVWKSGNPGQTWVDLNATLDVTQFYNIALHPWDPAQVMGGTQDNGTAARPLDADPWPQMLAGDGGFCAYDHQDPTIRYTTYIYLRTFRHDGSDWVDITGPYTSDPTTFIAPLAMDPNDSHTLIGGTNRVWRTQNAHAAADWTPISGTQVVGGGTYLYTLAVAHGASDTIYCGGYGVVHVTFDAAVWHDRSNGLPLGVTSDIVLNPEDPAEAYVSFRSTSGPRVLTTTDYGQNWSDVAPALPDGISAQALAVDWDTDPPGLYVGCGAGVYSSLDGGATWLKDGLDLPNVNVGDLAIDDTRRAITAGTYGRGAWQAILPLIGQPGDVDADNDVDLADVALFTNCFAGQGETTPPLECAMEHLARTDLDRDGDTDLDDYAALAPNLTGPTP